ncbi:hypothetical protein HDU67_004964, partial [Dinochytrium kinnereticum]
MKVCGSEPKPKDVVLTQADKDIVESMSTTFPNLDPNCDANVFRKAATTYMLATKSLPASCAFTDIRHPPPPCACKAAHKFLEDVKSCGVLTTVMGGPFITICGPVPEPKDMSIKGCASIDGAFVNGASAELKKDLAAVTGGCKLKKLGPVSEIPVCACPAVMKFATKVGTVCKNYGAQLLKDLEGKCGRVATVLPTTTASTAPTQTASSVAPCSKASVDKVVDAMIAKLNANISTCAAPKNGAVYPPCVCPTVLETYKSLSEQCPLPAKLLKEKIGSVCDFPSAEATPAKLASLLTPDDSSISVFERPTATTPGSFVAEAKAYDDCTRFQKMSGEFCGAGDEACSVSFKKQADACLRAFDDKIVGGFKFVVGVEGKENVERFAGFKEGAEERKKAAEG